MRPLPGFHADATLEEIAAGKRIAEQNAKALKGGTMDKSMVEDARTEQRNLLEELARTVTCGNLDMSASERFVHQILNTTGTTLMVLDDCLEAIEKGGR